MLGFPPPDCLPSIIVSTKKGGACKYRNEHRSISASCESPSGPNTWPHTALMHGMGMQQQYYGGNNHEASDPDSNSEYFSPGSSINRYGTRDAAARGYTDTGDAAGELSGSRQRCVHE